MGSVYLQENRGSSLVGFSLQYVKSEHSRRRLLLRSLPLNNADISRTFRGGSQSKYMFDPTPFRHGYIPNTSCKAGMIEKYHSHRPDYPSVVAMQARKWPTCFQGRYVQHFQVMSTSPGVQLTVLVVEPVSYMAKALAEFGDRRKGAGTPDI